MGTTARSERRARTRMVAQAVDDARGARRLRIIPLMVGPNRVDVVIVGARVAGCLTAIQVAEAGYRVLLLDAARFPSDTISTHFFRGAGLVGALHRVGLLDAVLAL